LGGVRTVLLEPFQTLISGLKVLVSDRQKNRCDNDSGFVRPLLSSLLICSRVFAESSEFNP
jgi:hypothetical protein